MPLESPRCHQCGQNPIGRSAHCSIHGCPFNGKNTRAVLVDKDTEIAVNEPHKQDQGKVRIELFPPEALFGISTVLTAGTQKYPERNWEKGLPWSKYFGALMRHMWAWWGGRGPTTENFAFGSIDDETGHSHLWHAGCCLVFLITYEERQVGTDDRPRSE